MVLHTHFVGAYSRSSSLSNFYTCVVNYYCVKTQDHDIISILITLTKNMSQNTAKKFEDNMKKIRLKKNAAR